MTKDLSSFTPFDVEEEPKRILNSIRLNSGISLTNFICAQLHYMIMVFAFGMSDTLQPLILLDKSYYNADKETAGTLIASILFIQLIVKISVSIVYGHWCDKFGRKTMLYFGTASFVFGMILAPCFSSIFPGFIIAKLFVSNGASAIGTLPLNADYIHDESKGRVAGITVTLNALGALVSNLFLKALLYSGASLGTCYWISAAIISVGFGLNSLGLKGGMYYMQKVEQRRNQLIESQAEPKTMHTNFKEAVKIFKENAWLSIALVLQILGNADFYLAFTILALYVKSLFPLGTDDRVSNIAVNNVQSFIFLPTLFSNIIYGCYIDKTKKVMNVIVIALIGGATGFIMVSSADTPYDSILYAAAFIIGSTITGVYVSSNYLCFTHYPPEKRGIMLGLTALVGYVGYVIIASGGGYLFDHWEKSAPFIMYAALSIIALIWVIKIYKTRLAS